MFKYLIVLIIATVFVNTSRCQQFTKETFQGSWKVVQVQVSKQDLPKEVKQLMEEMKGLFLNSTLRFDGNGKFTIKSVTDKPEFIELLKAINNTDWRFDGDKRMILIGTRSDAYNHLRFFVFPQGENIFFELNDTPLVLQVKKL